MLLSRLKKKLSFYGNKCFEATAEILENVNDLLSQISHLRNKKLITVAKQNSTIWSVPITACNEKVEKDTKSFIANLFKVDWLLLKIQ